MTGMSDTRWVRCLIASNDGDEAGRRELMEQAFRMATDAGDIDRADGAWLALRCFDVFERPEGEYREYQSQVVTLAEAADLANASIARCFLARSSLASGDHAQCVQHVVKGVEAAELSGYVSRAMSDSAYLGSILLEMGDLDGALEHMTGVLERARNLGWPSTIAGAASVLSQILAELGRTGAARDMAAEALEAHPSESGSIGRAIAAYGLAECELASENFSRAKELFESLRSSSIAEGHEVRLYSVIKLAKTECLLGNTGAALSLGLEGLALATDIGDRSAESLALDILGDISLCRGEDLVIEGVQMSPVGIFRRCVAISDSITSGKAAPAARKRLADALSAAGHLAEAVEEYKRVLSALERTKLIEAQKRAQAMEVRLKTERAIKEANSQRLLAQAESRRAAELQAMNAQLNATMIELETAQSRLLERNLQLSEAYAQIREMSFTDPLTGLKNRRYFTEAIASAIAECKRAHSPSVFGKLHADECTATGHDILFFLLDLDHFKSINDTFGHAAGDAVLVELARRLKSVTRDSDHLVRWGGEEVLVATARADRIEAQSVAERLRAAVGERPFDVGNGKQIGVTVSVGFAVFPPSPETAHSASWESVVETADKHLYAAKRGGRNRCVGDECSSAVALPTTLSSYQGSRRAAS